MMAPKRTIRPLRQEDIFKALMLALMMSMLEDLKDNTDHHALFFETAISACLDSGIAPEHPIAVMNAIAELTKTINVEIGKIRRRGECPN